LQYIFSCDILKLINNYQGEQYEKQKVSDT